MTQYLRLIIIVCSLSISFKGFSQIELPLQKFDRLVDGIWITEGEWTNGQKFKQEIDFEWGLNQTIIKVKTYGTIDPKSNEYGLRNEGVRAYNNQDSVIQFWEFDIYGGITKGVCYFEGENLHYEYNYNGQKLKESWFFIDENNYKYQISSLVEGKVDKVYMTSSYKRISKKNEQ
jgi:hypothetical protein